MTIYELFQLMVPIKTIIHLQPLKNSITEKQHQYEKTQNEKNREKRSRIVDIDCNIVGQIGVHER